MNKHDDLFPQAAPSSVESKGENHSDSLSLKPSVLRAALRVRTGIRGGMDECVQTEHGHGGGKYQGG
jgi:hypothetical protein